MSSPGQERSGSTLRAYLEAEHGSVADWARDGMISAAGWWPGIAGMALRAVWDRRWIRGSGRFAREPGGRILGARHLTIDEGVYLDRGVYLHGRPGGIALGAGTRVMAGAVLHAYNFRGLPHAGIKVGRRCVIGFNCVITGQGGVAIGDDVIMAPGAMVLPVDHVFADPARPIREQGITGKGIAIGAGAWIGAGALVLDGVTVGPNAVIAAGAVVSRDVAAGTTVAGNPARAIEKESQAKG